MPDDLTDIAKALAAFHRAVGPILKSAKADRYHYADLATVLAAVREPLATNGLSIVQLFEGEVLVTRLLHTSGQFIDSAMPIPKLEAARGMNALQSYGCAVSYCRRYAVLALLSLAAEDNDGAEASVPSEAPRSPGKAPQPEGVPF